MSIRSSLVIVGALVVSAGCVTKNNADVKIARAACDRFEECALGEFEEEYSSVADCVDDFTDPDERGVTVDCLDQAGCEFRADYARDCRSSIASVSCEEFVDGDVSSRCDDIWDCTNEQALEALECSR